MVIPPTLLDITVHILRIRTWWLLGAHDQTPRQVFSSPDQPHKAGC